MDEEFEKSCQEIGGELEEVERENSDEIYEICVIREKEVGISADGDIVPIQ